MDHNFAAWMIAGGPRTERSSERRDREQLHAFRESQVAGATPSLVQRIIERLRSTGAPSAVVAPDPACCAA